jgi:hypothetical protein
MEPAVTAETNRELLDFAVRFLQHRGALVERRAGRAMAVLPPSLASALESPDELSLGKGGEPLFYGSPFLDRLVHLATDPPPVVYGEVRIPYIKKEGFEVLIDEDLSFHKTKVRVIHRAESRLSYLVLYCRFVALSDERKEGLVRISIQEESGALIPGLPESLHRHDIKYFTRAKFSMLYGALPERTTQAALEEAGRRAREELSGFMDSMSRHLHRDVENTREYYEAMEKEMRLSLRDHRFAPEAREERKNKINELPAERERKVADLRKKYHVRVTVTAGAALRLLVPVAQISLGLRHRAYDRQVTATFNPLTRRLDPLTCERCRKGTHRLVPRPDGRGLRLECEICAARRSKRIKTDA